MKICNICGGLMVSGTYFDDKQHNRYLECPRCYVRLNGKKKSNTEISFKELLEMANCRNYS